MADSARIVFLFLVSLIITACGSSGGSSGPQTPFEQGDKVGLEAPAHGSTLLNKDFALAWHASENQGETDWGVTIYTTINGTKQTVMTLSTKARTYRPLQLSDNTTYTWKVEALNGEGETVAVSDEWTFHTYPTRMLPFAGALDQGSDPGEFTKFDGAVYFTAYSPEFGRELWKKEGASDAKQVADIRGGDESSRPQELTVCKNRLYFTANDGVNGRELWMLDTTGADPVLTLVEIVTGESEGSAPYALTAMGGALYFSARESVDSENTLWLLPEDSSVPVQVTMESEALVHPDVGVAYNGCLYVSAVSETAGRELWRVTGAAGTLLEINEGGASSHPKGFAVYDGRLYFRATTEGLGAELWVVEGESSPVLLKEIAPGVVSGDPDELTVSGDTLFFTAYASSTGRELWMTNGSPAGTTLVKEIVDGVLGSQPRGLTDSGGGLYFMAKTDTEGVELWKSDGSVEGTILVQDILPGVTGSSVNEIVPFGDRVAFRAEEGEAGKELWMSGGEAYNTFRVKDIQAGAKGGYPETLVPIDDTLWFRADDGLGGVELWQSDGTEEGTFRTDNINPYLDPGVDGVVKVGGTVVMVGTSGEYGRELFTIDADGQVSVLYDIFEGYKGSSPDNLFVHGSLLYFAAEDGEKGTELWVSDGTPFGTKPLKDVNPGDVSGHPGYFTAFNGKVYFLAQVGVDWQVWETDGLSGGTQAVQSGGNPVTVGASAADLALAAGDTRLFFRKGEALWVREKSGAFLTIEGVKNPTDLFPVSGSLLFSAETEGEEGPATLMLLLGTTTDVEPFLKYNGQALRQPLHFFRAGDMIYFSAWQGESAKRSLYRFSSSNTSVSLVTDTAGQPLLRPEELCGEDGQLWFVAGPDTEREIWKVQAEGATAQSLASIAAGNATGEPESLRPVGDALYFMATHPSQGKPCLYMARGTTIGPVLDFQHRPLLDAKHAFALDGFLFLTAMNPDTITTQPVQGIWVTSPPSF
ncbi:hypothetical protein DSLASN_17350 [Desulfoluna limicola]|uniref:Fibronectin type-III domain-containing protein n=1 Tax=Desulfoluna limicola TaxID=2810562 RepID=A0ABM7PFU9_9BACT|nr:hypothetical protein [Desulfoluna limicola]BCS96103.1 hypothetical protein DSLASN_17350 [Desulfoluna limicola]